MSDITFRSTIEDKKITSVLINQPEIKSTLLVGQGPAGPAGRDGISQEGAFLVNNRFNEISENEIAKVEARINLGCQIVDGGVF